jgi:biopolymer transport protein ExbD
MRGPQEEFEAPIELKITALIDVLFAILTFFVLSAVFLTRSEGLSVNLPKAATAKSQQQTKIALSIKPDGQLALNKQPIALDQVEPGVRLLTRANQQLVVVLHADEKVEHGQVVAVMDRLKKVEGLKMAIATRRP